MARINEILKLVIVCALFVVGAFTGVKASSVYHQDATRIESNIGKQVGVILTANNLTYR
jgi:hypothetical protein